MASNGFEKTVDMDIKEGRPPFTQDIRVRLVGESPFFGPGVAWLMEGIEGCGSVASACEAMGLSYSKGRGMIRKMEKLLGFGVVERLQGGAGGGSARLTQRGKELLEAYNEFDRDVKEYAQRRFQGAFLDFLEDKEEEG